MIMHSELPRRAWPTIKRSAAQHFFRLGLPLAIQDRKEISARYRKNNLERVRERARLWAHNNPGQQKKQQSLPAYRQYKRRYEKRRRERDPEFKIRQNLRLRTRLAMGGTLKAARTLQLLGCTIPELRAHLESQFRPGMTWENYGPVWHIDHRRPCASFDLLDPAQQRECFNFKNLQPLFAEENLKKSDSWDDNKTTNP